MSFNQDHGDLIVASNALVIKDEFLSSVCQLNFMQKKLFFLAYKQALEDNVAKRDCHNCIESS